MFVPRGTNISYTQERGDKHFSHTGGWANIFALRGGETFLHRVGGRQTFFVGGSGAYDDVDEEEEMVVSEANFLGSGANNFVSEASKLSAGARIFRGP